MTQLHAVRRWTTLTAATVVIAIPVHSGLAQSVAPPTCALRGKADRRTPVLGDSAAAKRWTPTVLASIARHEVCVGMSRDMMTESWGLARMADTVVPRVPGDSVGYYYYENATVVVVNSVVRAIRPPRSAKDGRP